MKRTILASVTVGLAALMTFGCGNVGSALITGNENNSLQPIAGPAGGGAGQVFRIFAVDALGDLLSFMSDNPSVLQGRATPTGLPVGERLVAIDFRTATGVLYGITTSGKLFYIDKTTAQCFQVGPGVAPGQVACDIDFNPVVDRYREVGAAQNVRVNPNTGVLAGADGNLNIGGVPANGVGTAYTNNFAGATTTQLFTVDAVAQQIYLQNPATGALTQPVSFPFFIGNSVGFDFAPNNLGFLALTPSGSTTSKLFTFEPVSGTLLPQPEIAGGRVIKSIAVEIGAPAVTNFVGIDETNNLVKFNSLAPQTLTSSVLITGIAGADVIRGCDFRPSDNSFNVFTLAAGGVGKIFRVDTTTGVAALVPAPQPVALTGGVDEVDTSSGIDFNPVLDLLRIVNGKGLDLNPVPPAVVTTLTQNFSVVPVGGATTNNGVLNYAAGDPGLSANALVGPLVSAAAHTQSFAGSQASRLFVVDSSRDTLCLVATPAAGILTTIGGLSVNVTDKCGLDIEANDRAWMVAQPLVTLDATVDPHVLGGAAQSLLCRVNLATGQADPVSQVGGGVLVDFAVVPTTVTP